MQPETDTLGRAILRVVGGHPQDQISHPCGDYCARVAVNPWLVGKVATTLVADDNTHIIESDTWVRFIESDDAIVTQYDSGNHTVELYDSPYGMNRYDDIVREWTRVDESAYVVLWSARLDSLILARGIDGTWHSTHLQGTEAHDTLEYLSNCNDRYTVPVALTEYVLWDAHQNLADCRCDSDQIVELATGSSYRILYGTVA